MSTFMSHSFNQVKFGIVIVVLSLLYGLGMGVAFGVFEHNIKDTLKEDAAMVFDTVYNGDQKKMDKIVKKSWTYIKRAHFHSTGMASMALIFTLVASILPLAPKMKLVIPILVGLGSFGYPLSWHLAGLKAPGLGSTGAAKESLEWLAYPSVILFMVGFILLGVLAIMSAFRQDNSFLKE